MTKVTADDSNAPPLRSNANLTPTPVDNHSSCPLFSSDLPSSVFALYVLDFLSRDEISQIMEEKGLREQFHLDNYYCKEHGTQLQPKSDFFSDDEEEESDEELKTEVKGQEGREEEEEKEEEKKEELKELSKTKPVSSDEKALIESLNKVGLADTGESPASEKRQSTQGKKEKKMSKLVCEDCVKAELGLERCPACDLFSPEEDVKTCENCKETHCDECWYDDAGGGFCELCGVYYCGSESNGMCQGICFCEDCEICFCHKCASFQTCGKCFEDSGCTECMVGPEVFTCDACFDSFHFECQNSYICGECQDTFCSDCKDHFYCSSCGEEYCKSCSSWAGNCEECGASLCKDCAFKCAECETLSCRGDIRCSKPYKCSECDKQICAECQDVFQKCCCPKKGKFECVAHLK